MSRSWRCTSAEGSDSAILESTCSARSRSPALKKSSASSKDASRRCSGGRSSRFTRSWCMRMARSTSPRRRKRLPSANCSSTVCGFSFAACRNDSIALSGCSFRRKLRPRKYDEGIARDSESSDFKSTRAVTQPRPKNTGKASSHQNSNSMGRLCGRGHGNRRRRGALAREAAIEARDLPALAHDGGHPREDPDQHAGDEHDEENEDEGQLPRLVEEAAQLDRIGVLHREPDQHDHDQGAEDQDGRLHSISLVKVPDILQAQAKKNGEPEGFAACLDRGHPSLRGNPRA